MYCCSDEYEGRLRDLETERQAVEEERLQVHFFLVMQASLRSISLGFDRYTTPPPPQVDRYKQLLLKQRDIMIALTARLNERDDQINMLQVRLPGGSVGVWSMNRGTSINPKSINPGCAPPPLLTRPPLKMSSLPPL